MVAVVKTFNYTGTLQQTTDTGRNDIIDVHLWGGAGGGGRSDAGRPGRHRSRGTLRRHHTGYRNIISTDRHRHWK
jgi:hypothetical protein